MNITFSFGKNWKNYVSKAVDEKSIEISKKSLLEYLPESEFRGKTFIDIGCGSGVFSLAAMLIGCKKVISFDLDVFSMEATKLLRERFYGIIPKGAKWETFQGSIVEDITVASLRDSGDIVYSWGVLHHTGNMWKAIENSLKLVKDNGCFVVSIYNHASSSRFWKKVKQFYNGHPLLQPLFIAICAVPGSLLSMMKNKNWSLKRKRGMHVFYDVIDWLGGYPYEFACFDDVKAFVEKRGFELIKAPTMLPCEKNKKASLFDIITARNTACNEFVFRKT